MVGAGIYFAEMKEKVKGYLWGKLENAHREQCVTWVSHRNKSETYNFVVIFFSLVVHIQFRCAIIFTKSVIYNATVRH